MKAQKLGLVLGMNMAVACLVLQGCKATRQGVDNNPPPVVDPIVEPAPEPVGPAPTTTTTVTTVTTEPAPVVVEPQPTKVTAVKPLPPPAAKPAPKLVAAPKPVVAEGFVYVVKPGDQLFAVSRRYNVKLSAIERANPGLNPNKIRVGQKIRIPGVTGPAAVADKSAKSAKVVQASAPAPTAANTVAPVKTKAAFKAYTGPTKEYKVRSGDSLGKIAYENGITIRALKEMNKLTKDSLRVNQTLLIPAEKVVVEKKPAADKPAVKPVEKKAEVSKPVEKKDAAVPAPAPASAPAPVVAPAKPEAPVAPVAVTPPPEQKPVVEVKEDSSETVTQVVPAAATYATYVVKEGDDIVSVAIAWGVSPSQLMDLNDLKAGDSIKPGQVLKLPANAKQAVQ